LREWRVVALDLEIWRYFAAAAAVVVVEEFAVEAVVASATGASEVAALATGAADRSPAHYLENPEPGPIELA
jgi:hypothetical protein